MAPEIILNSRKQQN